MRRAVQSSFTAASILFVGLALMMAFIEVVHVSQGQGQSTGHFAGIFAVQALALAGVFTASAITAGRYGRQNQIGPVPRFRP